MHHIHKRSLSHLDSPSSPPPKKQRRDAPSAPHYATKDDSSRASVSSTASTHTLIGSTVSSPPAQNPNPSASDQKHSNDSSYEKDSKSSSRIPICGQPGSYTKSSTQRRDHMQQVLEPRSNRPDGRDASSDPVALQDLQSYRASIEPRDHHRLRECERLEREASEVDASSDEDEESSDDVSSSSFSSSFLSSSEAASADEDDISSFSSSSSSSSESGASASSSSFSSSDNTHPISRPGISAAPLTTSNLSYLQSRLTALLPKLRYANDELEIERREGWLGNRDIEKLDEDEGGHEDGINGENGKPYIEMNLGLGVLEERRETVSESEEEPSTSREGDEKDDEEEKEEVESGILETLLGKKQRSKGREKVNIQDVGVE